MQNRKSMKISLVQFATPNIDIYAKYSIASTFLYAQKHGYGYYLQREGSLEDLHINYSKIDALKTIVELPKEGKEDECVVVIDSDMVIIEQERTMEWFMETFGNEESAIFMPQDVGRESHKLKRPCAGFIMVKKNEAGIKVMQDWIHACYNEGLHFNDGHPYEQGVYWTYILPKLGQKQVIMPLKYFEYSPIQRMGFFRFRKPFLDHLLRRSSDVRAKMMGDLYNKFYNDDQFLQEMESFLNSNTKEIYEIQKEDGKLICRGV